MNIDILEKRIEKVLGRHPLTQEEISSVENDLKVRFPEIFVKLNKRCSYEYAGFDFFNFRKKGTYSLVTETLAIRKTYDGDSNKFVVLYTDDAGIVILNTEDENASVMWCSIYDIENVFNNLPLEHSYEFFPTFADFFTYLLDEEEAEGSGK
jgi:hypothetical protein